MKKRQYISIFCAFLFFTIAAGLEFFFTKERNLASYKKRIEEALHQKEAAVVAFFEDEAFLKRRFLTENELDTENGKVLKDDLTQLTLLTTKDYNICLYKNDSLFFWTNNRAFPNPFLLKNLHNDDSENGLVNLNNGYYEYIYRSFSGICQDCFGVALIPIKNNYQLESDYLQNRFISNHENSIPKEVLISDTLIDFKISSANGKPLLYLDAKKDIKDKSQLQVLLLFYFLAFIALGFIVNDLRLL